MKDSKRICANCVTAPYLRTEIGMSETINISIAYSLIKTIRSFNPSGMTRRPDTLRFIGHDLQPAIPLD